MNEKCKPLQWPKKRPPSKKFTGSSHQESSKNQKNIWYNTGHGHLGWTLSAYTAQKTADEVWYSDLNS